MIRYTLKCTNAHIFDSWFQSAAAFDSLHAAGHTSCPTCGDKAVQKTLMAPNVAKGSSDAADARAPSHEAPAGAARPQTPLSAPQNETEKAIAAMREQVEKNSDYVGVSFAAEARKMHAGDTPTRAIWGEAKPQEARALLEEGVPILPLPFLPKRKTN
ncbi:hypothetical protein AQS8620_02166 [Aquimixticola soesokkakensis]|uniref:DUF1178 family protein n=1 Tax=Aquimixticola soesokkakensis TaxID=1519096 RepID=A0A1Y5SWY7_9RHOB|nr:DUF1178 family protein [Aquimixticola soesokkakensis]SLN50331.1 hypothetical protein AQS8620_02166 [Aquimixticola soesokkakensis]